MNTKQRNHLVRKVIEADLWIRKNNKNIPDNVLDLMKNSALKEIEREYRPMYKPV